MRLSFMTKYNISEQELRDYEYAVQEMHIEDRDRLHEWSYYQSLYFVSTVTTTIGKWVIVLPFRAFYTAPEGGCEDTDKLWSLAGALVLPLCVTTLCEPYVWGNNDGALARFSRPFPAHPAVNGFLV